MGTSKSKVAQFDPNRPRRQPLGPDQRKRLLRSQTLNTRAQDLRRPLLRPPTPPRHRLVTVDKEYPLLTHEDLLEPPASLSKDKRRIFESFQDVIIENEIAQVTDKFVVHMLCIEFTHYLDVCEQIALEGFMIEGVNSQGIPFQKPNPLLVERSRLFRSVKSLAGDFGLIPRKRQKVLQKVIEESPIIEEKEEEEVDPEEAEWDELLG